MNNLRGFVFLTAWIASGAMGALPAAWAAVSADDLDPKKLTVCSITINSDDEI